MKPRVSIILIDNKKILLIHRIKEEKEYWVLPGGSIECEESKEEACIREVNEETGLEIKIIQELMRFDNQGRNEIYFLVEPTGGKLQLGEPEKSRQSITNQYILEWTSSDKFSKLNFQPKTMKNKITEIINKKLIT
jgi:ADP-ribose pyrophosphatase YjhB (NUDIX family)